MRGEIPHRGGEVRQPGTPWMTALALVLVPGPCLVGRCEAGVNDPPPGFYAGTEGKTGGSLVNALHARIDGHTVISYSQTDEAMSRLDEAAGSTREVELLYTTGTRLKTAFGGDQNSNGGSGDWNREHVWPRGFGIESSGPDNSDLFNLRPTDVDTNQKRGSLVFDDSRQPVSTYSGALGSTFDSNSWEPPDDVKGNVARACFYMAVRYDGSDGATNDLRLGASPNRSQAEFGQVLTLLRWHRDDPVDDAERSRNQRIFSQYQGNRNPFIDRPEFAELAFLADFPELDSDGDGLGDFWEWSRVGSLDENAADDNDGDGADNALELALAMDPSQPDPELLPAIRWDSSGAALEIDFRRARQVPGLATQVEMSASLKPDDWLPAAGAMETVTPVDADVERVVVRIPAEPGRTHRFFRVRVVLPQS